MKHLITFAFLAAAILFYAVGFGPGAKLAIALGVVAETIFWFRFLRLLRRRRTATDATIT
jgi:hypothetical protein